LFQDVTGKGVANLVSGKKQTTIYIPMTRDGVVDKIEYCNPDGSGGNTLTGTMTLLIISITAQQ
jgi:hypothetical protein